jgi:hypothetical protein
MRLERDDGGHALRRLLHRHLRRSLKAKTLIVHGDHVPITGPRAEPFAKMAAEFLGGNW